MNAGGYGTARTQSRLRAAVNARLEEISFRTGLIAATIGLVALFAIAAAGVFAATLSIGNQAIAAAGALSSASAPKTTPTVTASAPPATYPQASSTPQASHPVTTATTSPQAAADSRPLPQAAGTQAAPRYSGQAGYGSHASWYGRASWYGGGSSYSRASWYGGGSSYGHGSWYGRGSPGYGGRGFPGHGFGFARPGSRNLYRVCVPQNGTNKAGFCPKRGTSSRKSHLGDVPICPARYFSDD